MKRTLMAIIFTISLMLVTSQICYGGAEPAGCTYPGVITLVGHPIVGTLVIDYLGQSGSYSILSYDLKGCCAECFDRCKPSCNIRLNIISDDLAIKPFQITKEDLYRQSTRMPEKNNCNPTIDGSEVLDVLIETVLDLQHSDIDGDGEIEAVAKVIMIYWKCILPTP